MSFEPLIGLRFLAHTHARRRLLFTFCGAGLALVVAGTVIVARTGSPFGVVLSVLGALTAIVSGLFTILSVFTAVSVFGVILGVAALTMVLAVTSGFQLQFRDKVLGVNAHVLVMRGTTDFPNYRDVEEMARRQPHVVAVEPFIFEELLITRGRGDHGVIAFKGVDPARVQSVLDVGDHMIEGSIDSLGKAHPGQPPPMVIGKELALKLKAKVGDVVTVVSPVTSLSGYGSMRPPRTGRFVVSGIFYCGFAEYDGRLTYVSLEAAQEFLDNGDSVRGVELRLDDVDQAWHVARRIERQLKGEFMVLDWRELNENLFTALTLQKWALVIFLTLIIIVAAFNLVASLTMMVHDKTKEIAILRAMGSTHRSVATVFQIVGLTIGVVGTGLGLGLGLLLCHVVSVYGYPLDPKVYLIDRLPIRVEPVEVVMTGLITLVISFLATLYPSLRASALRPVDGLRGE